jgi:hypothetical protein
MGKDQYDKMGKDQYEKRMVETKKPLLKIISIVFKIAKKKSI